MFIVFDLDGTLSDNEHRAHLVAGPGPKNWDAYTAACVDDPPVPEIISVANALFNEGHQIEIWSGRDESARGATIHWLCQYGVRYRALLLRKHGDHRLDTEVKLEWLSKRLPLERPRLVFEDRERMVNFWRSQGILCAQVAPGRF